MKLDNSQFDSPQKQIRRSSILKHRTDYKEGIKQQPKGLSTTIRHSVKFKEPHQQQKHVRQFNQTNKKSEKQRAEKNIFANGELNTQHSYTKWAFFKDVNNINYLYSNVLVMAAQNCKKSGEKVEQGYLLQMNKAIQELVFQNKKLKDEIDQKQTIYSDLQQLSEYLRCTVDDLINQNKLQSFIDDYTHTQQEWNKLQQQIKNIGDYPKHKSIGLTEAQIKQKQKKCQALRKKIEKQKNAIKKLQKEETQLLKNLYISQKEVAKNERLSSALKLKINQIQIDNQYKNSKSRAKSMCKQNQNKQNIQPTGQLKHAKINNRQNLKSKVSLARLLKKR